MLFLKRIKLLWTKQNKVKTAFLFAKWYDLGF